MKDIRNRNYQKKSMAMMSVLGLVITAFFVFHIPAQYVSLSIDVSPNAITNNMSVSIGRVAYIDQPAQAMFSLQNPQTSPYSNVSNNQTAVITSSYLTLVSNKTTSATTGFSVFNLTNSVAKGNTSFLYVSERLAFNGTGESDYMILGQNKVTTSAPTTGHFAYFEYGSSSASFVFNNTTATVTKPVTASGSALSPLTFYTATIEATPTAIEFTLEENGALLDNIIVTTSTSGLGSYISTLNTTGGSLYLSNLMSATTGTGNALVMDYFYYLDHYTFTSAPITTPSIQSDFVLQGIDAGTIVHFDPSVVAVNESTNATVNYSTPANTAGTGSYTSIVNSSSNQSRIASALNTSEAISNATLSQNYTFLQNGIAVTTNGVVNGSQAVTTLRSQGDNATHTYASYIINGWNSSTVSSVLQNDIASTVNATTGIPLSHIEIVSYLVTDVAVDTNFSQSVVNSVDNTLYNEVPSQLQADNLSLVNTSTGAISAGYDVGMYYNLQTGAVSDPIVVNGMIENPFTQSTYKTPESAGFPNGSIVTSYATITGGKANIVAVSQFNVQNGAYSFNDMGLYDTLTLFHYTATQFSLFGGLTGAGKAISSFFKSGDSTITNAVTHVTSTIPSDYKIVTNSVSSTASKVSSSVSADVNKFISSTSSDLNQIIPAIGGVATNLKSDIAGNIGSLSKSLTTGVGQIDTQLGSVTKEMQGALAAGVGGVKTDIYHLGNSLNTTENAIVSTLGSKINSIDAVLSPLFTSVQNLPNEIKGMTTSITASISSQVANSYAKGMAVLDSVGQTIKNETINGASKAVSSSNSFGSMIKGFLGSTGQFFKGAGGVFSWFINIAKAVGHYLIPALIIIGVFIVALIFMLVYFKIRGAKKLFKRFTGRTGKTGKIRSESFKVDVFDISENFNVREVISPI